MDDNQKDVAIIEASALLVTLIFVILSFYSSNLAQYYSMLCSSNPNGCVRPPWLTNLSDFVTTLTYFTYAVGFFFVVAAVAATVRLFLSDSAWQKAGLQIIEFWFFLLGLIFLAAVFFSRAPANLYQLAFIAFVTLGSIAVPLWWAHHRRHVIEAGGST